MQTPNLFHFLPCNNRLRDEIRWRIYTFSFSIISIDALISDPKVSFSAQSRWSGTKPSLGAAESVHSVICLTELMRVSHDICTALWKNICTWFCCSGSVHYLIITKSGATLNSSLSLLHAFQYKLQIHSKYLEDVPWVQPVSNVFGCIWKLWNAVTLGDFGKWPFATTGGNFKRVPQHRCMEITRFPLSLRIKSIMALSAAFVPVNCILWCRYIFFCPSETIMSPHLALLPFCSLLWGSCSFILFINRIKMSPSLGWFFFCHNSCIFFLKSSSSSQSPFNWISINLLNGFKNSLALVRVSKARIGPGKHGHSLAELDAFQGDSAPTGRLSLMKLMGLEEAANPRF